MLCNKIFARGFFCMKSNLLNIRKQVQGENLAWKRVVGASSLVCIVPEQMENMKSPGIELGIFRTIELT